MAYLPTMQSEAVFRSKTSLSLYRTLFPGRKGKHSVRSQYRSFLAKHWICTHCLSRAVSGQSCHCTGELQCSDVALEFQQTYEYYAGYAAPSSSLERQILKSKSEAIPATGRGGAYGCEMLRIPHCLDNRLTDGGKLASPKHRPRSTPHKHCFPATVLISVRG
jgi:hypothetical protein